MRLLPLCALTTCALAAPRGRGGTPTKPSTSERQRRLYDRGCLFSPEGRVYQVEYAEKNVARGSFAVGAVAPDGVALAAVRSAHARSVPGAFLERRWRERVHRVDDTIACVACGLVPDALQLLAALRDFCRRHRSTWGEAPPVEACARHLGRLARAATARAAGRPYGAAFLIGGFDEGSSEPRLFRTEPSGAYEAYGVGGVATAGAAPDGSTIADLERAAAAFGDVADGADAAYAAAVAAAEASPPTDRSDAVATDVELAVLRPSGCVICDADELAERFERRASAATES